MTMTILMLVVVGLMVFSLILDHYIGTKIMSRSLDFVIKEWKEIKIIFLKYWSGSKIREISLRFWIHSKPVVNQLQDMLQSFITLAFMLSAWLFHFPIKIYLDNYETKIVPFFQQIYYKNKNFWWNLLTIIIVLVLSGITIFALVWSTEFILEHGWKFLVVIAIFIAQHLKLLLLKALSKGVGWLFGVELNKHPMFTNWVKRSKVNVKNNFSEYRNDFMFPRVLDGIYYPLRMYFWGLFILLSL